MTTHTAKQRIKEILFDKYSDYRLLCRRDDVFIHTQPSKDKPQSSTNQKQQNNTTTTSTIPLVTNNIPGCVFLLEKMNEQPQNHHQHNRQPLIYFLWVPYLLLLQFDNGRLVRHVRKNGQEVTSADFAHVYNPPTSTSSSSTSTTEQQSGRRNPRLPPPPISTTNEYVSASITSRGDTTNHNNTSVNQLVVRDEQYSMALRLQDISTIKRHIPNTGYPFLIINQSTNDKIDPESSNNKNNGVDGFEEINHSDVISSSVSYPPLYFHDGGTTDLLRILQSRYVIAPMPSDNNLFKVLRDVNSGPSSPLNANNKQLEHTLNQMHFHGYFEDVCVNPEPVTISKRSNSTKSSGLFEWGAKISKQARDILASGNQNSKIKVPDNLPQVATNHISLNNFHFKIDDSDTQQQQQQQQQQEQQEQQQNNDNGTETKLYDYVDSNIDYDYIPSEEAATPQEQEHDQIQQNNLQKLNYELDDDNFDDFEFVEQPEPQKKPSSNIIDTDERFAELASLLNPKYDQTHKLTMIKWKTLFDSDGTAVPNASQLFEEIRDQIYYGGIDESDDQLRAEVWKYLLGYYSFEGDQYRTREQREQIDQERSSTYESIKQQWMSITPQQEQRFALFRERKGRIDKDVVRTDRSVDIFVDQDSQYLIKLRSILISYGMWNFDLGYCQGMGDLLSPILHVIRDESQSFWCFVCLMESPLSLETNIQYSENDLFEVERLRQEGNGSDNIYHMQLSGHFEINSKYMEKQLQKLSHIVEVLDREWYSYLEKRDANNFFFCFRWILVLFKREFSFVQIKSVWERLWSMGFNRHHDTSHPPCSMNEYILFMCYGILRQHKNEMMNHNEWSFDDILKYCVDLSQKINADQSLRDAETVYQLYLKVK
jgi:hypothetical protein